MKSTEKHNLPQGWAWATIGEVIEDTVEQKPPQEGKEFLYIDISSIDNRSKIITSPKTLPTESAPSRAKQHLKPGDVVVSMTRPNLNAVALVPQSVENAIGSTGFRVLRSRWVSPLWLFYYVQTKAFVNAMSNSVRGALYPAIRPKDIDSYKIPIAPLHEQLRITAEIEKQFTRLDSVVKGIRRIQNNLGRYRELALRDAFEGKLVPSEAELSGGNKDAYEMPSDLLERVLAARRAKWEVDYLDRVRAQGKKVKGDDWKSNYKIPSQPDTTSLPELPDSWVWTSLATLTDIRGGITKGQQRKPKEILRSVPYLRVANVQRGYLDLKEIKYIDATEQEINEYRLLPDDILLTEGGDRDKLGRGWVWNDEIPECIHQNHIFRARPYVKDLQSKFISWYGNSSGREYFIKHGKQTTNLASINLTTLSALPIPLPSVPEQKRIVAELERRLSLIENLGTIIEANLKRIDSLRQKILKQAFEGKLVPPSPEGESADILLEQIKLEKTEIDTAARASRGQIKKARKAPPSLRKDKDQLALPFDTAPLKPLIPSTATAVNNMKLISLKLNSDYKSLDNFNQTFRSTLNEDASISPVCLVGLNGSGKSNLIEALSEIFCYLELINLPYEKIPNKARQTDLRFEIEYELPVKKSRSGRRIRVSKQDDSSPLFLEIINGDEKLIEGSEAQLAALPTRIVGYSSGLNETVSIPFFRIKAFYSREVAERALRKSDEMSPVEDPRTLFMDYDSNAAILLANYLFAPRNQLQLFREYLRIDDISSFQIVVQLTYASRRRVKLTPELEDSIARLQQCATTVSQEGDEDRLVFTYDITTKTKNAFRQHFGNAKNFFTTVYKLSLLNTLALKGAERKFYLREDVKEGLLEKPPTVSKEDKIFNIEQLRLKLTLPEKEIDYAGISDGEHQFIHVFGTVKLFDEPGCLFLLDEPETHFNPQWRRMFVQILDDISSSKSEEFVISTHSPFIVSGCRGENVFKFQRQGDRAVCKPVDFETFGSSFDFILTQLFDLKALISEQAFGELRDAIKSNSLAELEGSVGRFGESFEKRFLFEKIARVKSKRK